jgi:beta-glucanase (GH16 family)
LVPVKVRQATGWDLRAVSIPGHRGPSALKWGAGVSLSLLFVVVGAIWVVHRSHQPARSGAAVARTPAGMHPVFSDDFSGSSLDTSKWDTCYPWWPSGACTNSGNDELEWYLPTQVRVSGSVLHLTASKIPTAGKASDGSPTTYPWRSGMVTTYHSFDFTYGYVRVTAQVPKGDGLWSALWLLPQSESSRPEIDIAEVQGNDPAQLSVVLHGVSSRRFRTFNTYDLSRGWHTFAVDWERSSIDWYVDGAKVFSYTGPGVPHEPMYFLADLAVGNFTQAHPTASTPRQASLDIRDVAIYQR